MRRRDLFRAMFPWAALAQQPPVTLSPYAPFRVSARLVEAYVTVHDQRGKYVASLSQRDFRLFDDGHPREISHFEHVQAGVSLAILLDTTGSMRDDLPRLKNSTVSLVDHLRDSDEVAIYGFTDRLARLQPFTRDRSAVRRAIWRTRAEGETALFDAIAGVCRDLERCKGKKAALVFTDGDDNRSILSMDAAANCAKRSGVPVYSAAMGGALKAVKLYRTLEEISKGSGALAFRIAKPAQMGEMVEEIGHELQHTYLLAFRPAEGSGWRRIQVIAGDGKDLKIRCREGYWAD